MNTLQDVLCALQKAERVAIFTHLNPDGDALGSSLAMRAALLSAHKRVTVFLEKPAPERYGFLQPEYALEGNAADFDAALALDCGSIDRLGTLQPLFSAIKKRLVVDHHESDAPFGDVYYTEPSAAACCELVYSLIQGLCGSLPKETLAPLYTGLSTDTGHFKYSNVTPKTFRIAADLLENGLEQRPITRALYDTVKLEKLKFTGTLGERVQLFNNGTIAVLHCPDSLLESFHLLPEDMEELPNTVLSIEGVQVSVVIKTKSEKQLKISLRCKENIDLAALSSQFGGGGHKCAAGFVTSLSASEITEQLVKVIEKQLEEMNV